MTTNDVCGWIDALRLLTRLRGLDDASGWLGTNFLGIVMVAAIKDLQQ